jgi:hypothetical protein
VTLVTEGNLFLETGLALFPSLEVTTVRPEDWEEGRLDDRKAESGEDDTRTLDAVHPPRLTIFDRYVPITASLPSGNLFFIAPPRSSEVFSVTGRVAQPTPRVTASGDAGSDPLLTHVQLSGVSVLEAVRVSLPIWARPVLMGDTSGGAFPLLWAGERQGQRVAVLAFDLRHSDLPLQVAFPLLLANLTNWLAPAGGSDLPTQVEPGAAISLALPPDVNTAGGAPVRVVRPDGSGAQLAVEDGQAILADTGQLGVYEVRWGEEGALWFAVNLFSPQESDVRPADNLALAGSSSGGIAGSDEPARNARREWWRPLAFAALALLVAEWLVYHRASVARLWAGLLKGTRRRTSTAAAKR